MSEAKHTSDQKEVKDIETAHGDVDIQILSDLDTEFIIDTEKVSEFIDDLDHPSDEDIILRKKTIQRAKDVFKKHSG